MVEMAAHSMIDVPMGHIDDEASMAVVLAALRAIHGAEYDFASGQWDGPTELTRHDGRVLYRFVVRAEDARAAVGKGALVRGVPPSGPLIATEKHLAFTIAPWQADLWPGDVVTVDGRTGESTMLTGRGTYFDVIAEATDYVAPSLALLRYLPDRPGGCAQYEGAFRREALPPLRSPADAVDRRGANRVNEHTLDMRIDREPPPIRHCHGRIPTGAGHFVNHSETAIILPRPVYDLPEVADADRWHIVIYRNPAHDGADTIQTPVKIPVRPGSIVVTPATDRVVMGHCFENAFAMLVAIPGFVAPYHMIDVARSRNVRGNHARRCIRSSV